MSVMSSLSNPVLLSHFEKYEAYHQTRGNLACHWLGIPGVTLSLLGILSHVSILAEPAIDLGFVVWFLGSLHAFRLDRVLALSYVPFTFMMYYVAKSLPLETLVIIQCVSWFFQLFGHFRFEKKSPAFLSNITSLLIGPMWTFAKLIGYHRPSPHKNGTEIKPPVR